jgi:hypothetical protein
MELKFVNKGNFLKMLDDLQIKQQQNVLRNGLRKSAKIILEQGKENYTTRKKGTSNNKQKDVKILETLKIKASKVNPLGMNVGTGYWIAGWVNSSTANRYTGGKNRKKSTVKKAFRGAIKGNNFWFDAVNQKINQAYESLENFIFQNLERIIRKNNRK